MTRGLTLATYRPTMIKNEVPTTGSNLHRPLLVSGQETRVERSKILHHARHLLIGGENRGAEVESAILLPEA